MLIKIPNAGAAGVLRDLSSHELPIQAWTDASNVRFLDGYARPFLGHGAVYGTPSGTPQHVLAVNIGAARYWIYATATHTYCVTITAGVAVHTDITHATPRTGVANQWTSTSLSGIPILNAGDTLTVPMRWDLNTANKFIDLDAWPAATYCKAIRAFGPYLVALNITKGSTNYGYMVKWSHPADPGGLPVSWDPTDTTRDAGEYDLAEGGDPIIDGLQLRDSFMIYKEQSVWRMDKSFNSFVFRFQKVLGLSGAMNRNCIVELDGFHFVLTGSDVIVHDGQTAVPVLDEIARRSLFQDMDVNYNDKSFVFKNPFLNEVFVCYTSIGSTIPDKAMVWNYKKRTVAYRSIPNLNHANFGTVDNTLSGTWASDSDPWNSDRTLWNGPDFTPNTARVLMASSDGKLYMLDSEASFDGVQPTWYLERRSLPCGRDELFKSIVGVRARIEGNEGETVIIELGGSNTDPYAIPEYPVRMIHTIGTTVLCDGMVSYRYPAIRFSNGTAYQARLDSYDLELADADGGMW